jgi:hypothetical protein
MDNEVALVDPISDPVEAHVDGFGSALFDCTIGDPRGTQVVSLDGGGGLWMAHINECGAEPGSLFAVVK